MKLTQTEKKICKVIYNIYKTMHEFHTATINDWKELTLEMTPSEKTKTAAKILSISAPIGIAIGYFPFALYGI